MDWIALAQDTDRSRALLNASMNIRVPLNSGNFLTKWVPDSFSGRTLLRRVSWLVNSNLLCLLTKSKHALLCSIGVFLYTF
jgi:hypothetical protein